MGAKRGGRVSAHSLYAHTARWGAASAIARDAETASHEKSFFASRHHPSLLLHSPFLIQSSYRSPPPSRQRHRRCQRPSTRYSNSSLASLRAPRCSSCLYSPFSSMRCLSSLVARTRGSRGVPPWAVGKMPTPGRQAWRVSLGIQPLCGAWEKM